MICYLYPDPTYLFFAADLPDLLYYSHIPAVAISLLVGLYVYLNAPQQILNRLLLVLAGSFSVWVILSLLVWAGNDASLFAFIWPFFGISAAFLAVFSIYFAYVFVNKEDAPLRLKFIFLLLLLPVLLLGVTDISISGFNLAWCDAFQYEGLLFKIYYTGLGFLAMAWILVMLIRAYQTAEETFKPQIKLMGIGIEFFLFSFMTIIFIVTQLTALGVLDDSRLEFYGLFGMTFFMVMMSILIVRFKSFNIGAHAADALVVALLLLVATQYTYANTTTTTVILTTVTLVLTALAGAYLIKSVRKEIEQREQLEHLTQKLDKANKRLKVLDKLKSEFVSIASHQLRSPLTSIRGYASMLLEGSFGKLSQKAEDAVQRISDSSKYMAYSIEDYLNVSRIQAGNMKYEYSDFNLKDEAEKIADDVRSEAVKKGLVLTFRSDMDQKGIVHADIGKTQQIIHNLVNNAMKYTPEGSIRIQVRDKKRPKRIFVDVMDTGIGMDPDTIDNMFEKFERADKANSVNVSGTGLGLYIARKMAQDMGGDVTATSEGEGMGSKFTLELPLEQ